MFSGPPNSNQQHLTVCNSLLVVVVRLCCGRGWPLAPAPGPSPIALLPAWATVPGRLCGRGGREGRRGVHFLGEMGARVGGVCNEYLSQASCLRSMRIIPLAFGLSKTENIRRESDRWHSAVQSKIEKSWRIISLAFGLSMPNQSLHEGVAKPRSA